MYLKVTSLFKTIFRPQVGSRPNKTSRVSEINSQMTFPIIFIQKILTEVCLEKCRSAINNENGARYRFAYDVLDRLIAESGQQTHYFHCDQIGIQREMTDKDDNLLQFGNYTVWGSLKEETQVTDRAYQPFRLQKQYADHETDLHYNFFRYYKPYAGQVEPLGLSISIVIHIGQQGRHIAGHNNFIPDRSILTANPQDFLDSFHQGNIQISRNISQNKEKVHFIILEVVLIRMQEMRLRQNGEQFIHLKKSPYCSCIA